MTHASSTSLQSVIVSDKDSVKLIQKKTDHKPKKGVTLPSMSNIAALFVKIGSQ